MFISLPILGQCGELGSKSRLTRDPGYQSLTVWNMASHWRRKSHTYSLRLFPGSDICYFYSDLIGQSKSHGCSWPHGGGKCKSTLACCKGGEPEILGSGANDYPTPTLVEVGGGGRTSGFGNFWSYLGWFPKGVYFPRSCLHKDKLLSYLLWIPSNWHMSWHMAMAQHIFIE